jgi:aromatic-L-amino-acid decarboxylase
MHAVPGVSRRPRRRSMTEANCAPSLDPIDWFEIRRDGHRMLDDMFDHLKSLRDQPVWRAPSQASLAEICESMPRQPTPLRDVHAQFMRSVLPFSRAVSS